MRYNRSPSPNGLGTKRSAVNSGRPTYPTAKPSPPKYSSPGTPTGAGLNCASSTYVVVFGTGRPIDTVAPTSSGFSIRYVLENVVFSVGPYPLMSTLPAANRSFTRATGSASPPASNCFTFASACGCLACICSNSAAVSHSDVTSASPSFRPNSSSDGVPAGYTTSFAPCSSAPHNSSVDASKEMGANCNHTSSGPKRAKSVSNTNRDTARCGTPTPLGFPVLPDVNITYARFSPHTHGPGLLSGCPAMSASHSVSTLTIGVPSARRRLLFSECCPTKAFTSASWTIHLNRSCG
ncbi:hypothetical protein GCM10012319_61180 [Comamonas sp. KCTC 72670]|nr:hypothetical protein GCM10012319_61180 [Comamonas sp. KCTC 72670]